MKLRRLSTFTALASVIVAAGSFTTASADAPLTDLGQLSVGDTATFTFECTTTDNSFFLYINPDTPDQTRVADLLLDKSDAYLLGYKYDTTGLAPGSYSAGIECADAGGGSGIYDYKFTLVAADPCAPVDTVDTVDVPKGPGRAPHGVLPVCTGSGSGIPITGSSGTTYILLLGTLAIAAGTGMLVVRRRIQS